MYSDKIDCFLKAENIKKLTEDDIDNLCELISIDKLRNGVIKYYKNSSTKGKKYGKGDKAWNKVDHVNPSGGFILAFFNYKLLKEDPIDDLVLEILNEKYLKTILGKVDYTNPTIEKIVEAIDKNENYKDYDRCLLKRVIGDDVSEEDFKKAKDDLPKPNDEKVTVTIVKKKAKMEDLNDEAKINQLNKQIEDLKSQNTALKTRNKELEKAVEEEKENTSDLKKQLKEKEKEYSECNKEYVGLKQKLNLLLKKEKVQINYENGDFDKENLMNLQKAIEDGFKAKDYKALQKIMVKTYVILGVFDGGKKK